MPNKATDEQWAAICQRAEDYRKIKAILTGDKYMPSPAEFVEGRHIDTGRVTNTRVDGYLERWSNEDKAARRKKAKRQLDKSLGG